MKPWLKKYQQAGGGLGGSVAALALSNKLSLWLDFFDLTSLYLDDQAVGGDVSADGNTVGLDLDKAQMDGKMASAFIDAQIDILGGAGSLDSPTGWTITNSVGGGIEITDGAIVFNGPNGTVEYTAVTASTGVFHQVRFIASASGTLQINCSGKQNGNYISVPIVVGVNEFIVVGSGLNNNAVWFRNNTDNDYIGTIDNVSVKEVPGLHFLQSDTPKEPRFSKRLKANADLSGQPELATNGGMDADANWTKGTGWSIGSGVATASSATGALTQPISVTAGKCYLVTMEVLTATAGSISVGFVGGSVNLSPSTATAKTITALLEAKSGNSILYVAVSSFSGTIDNVSVKEVPASQLYNALTGDGSDDLLVGEPFAYDQGSAAFVFAVQGDAQSARYIYSERSLSSSTQAYIITSGSASTSKLRFIIINDAGSVRLNAESTVDVFDGLPHVCRVIDTGVGYEFYVDGVLAGSGSYTRSGTLSLDVASLLATKTTVEVNHLDGDICDQFVVFKPGWTDAMIRTAEAAIASNIGVTLS